MKHLTLALLTFATLTYFAFKFDHEIARVRDAGTVSRNVAEAGVKTVLATDSMRPIVVGNPGVKYEFTCDELNASDCLVVRRQLLAALHATQVWDPNSRAVANLDGTSREALAKQVIQPTNTYAATALTQ